MTDSNDSSNPRRSGVLQNLSGFALQRVWLPGSVYAALPYFYLVASIAALLATIYIHRWYWIVPHYLLFSAACLHFSAYIFSRRKARSAKVARGEDSDKVGAPEYS